MYYNRKISDSFSKLLENGGELRWLFDYVKNNDSLDFLIGKNISKEWISIYHGLTRILSISQLNNSIILVDADKKYKSFSGNLYGKKGVKVNFQQELVNLIAQVENDTRFDRYFKNKKEGYYQNELSRKFGICGCSNDDFVIIDKEAVIGYLDMGQKTELLGTIQGKYKMLQMDLSNLNPQRYGKNLYKKAIGNELDFLALDKNGNILLIEYKHGTNTSGIYLSPLQIGMYYDIFTNFPKGDLECAISEMLIQKQKIGLINPDWCCPNCIKEIIPVLIISEYNYDGSAKIKFNEVLQFARMQTGPHFLNNLQTYNYTTLNGLVNW